MKSKHSTSDSEGEDIGTVTLNLLDPDDTKGKKKLNKKLKKRKSKIRK